MLVLARFSGRCTAGPPLARWGCSYRLQCPDAPPEVCELALGHVNGNRVEAAYRRTDLFDRRRVLMNDWAA